MPPRPRPRFRACSSPSRACSTWRRSWPGGLVGQLHQQQSTSWGSIRFGVQNTTALALVYCFSKNLRVKRKLRPGRRGLARGPLLEQNLIRSMANAIVLTRNDAGNPPFLRLRSRVTTGCVVLLLSCAPLSMERSAFLGSDKTAIQLQPDQNVKYEVNDGPRRWPAAHLLASTPSAHEVLWR